MKTKITIKNIYFYIICVALFIFSLMFPIIDLKVIMGTTIVLALAGLFFEQQQTFDGTFIVIAFTFILIAYIDLHAEVYTSTMFAIILPLSYMIGKFAVGTDAKTMDKRIVIILLSITLGLLIQGFLNYYMEYQLPNFQTDNWTEFWSQKEDVSRSLFEFHFIYFTSMIGVAVLGFRKYKIQAIIVFIIDIAIQFLVAKSEGRLNPAILLGVLILTLMIYFVKGWKTYSDKIKRTIVTCSVVIIAVFVIFCILYIFNIFGLKDIYLNSYLNSSGGFIHNVRFAMMAEGLKMMTQNPLGGWAVSVGKTYGMVNCVWFLFAQEYDNVIFTLMFIFQLLALFQTIKLIRCNLELVDYWLIGVYSGLNVYYIMETCPWRYREYFIFLFVLYGIIKKRVELKKHVLYDLHTHIQ